MNLGNCIPCGIDRIPTPAITMVDDDPMCQAHAIAARSLSSPATSRGPLCGCGKPLRHRGACPGTPSLPSPAPFGESLPSGHAPKVADVRFEPVERVERRAPPGDAKRIKIADIPEAVLHRAPTGRIGLYWQELLNLPDGEALHVKSLNVNASKRLRDDLRAKGREMKRIPEIKRAGVDLYAWLPAKS